ncbi:MAG: sigma-70 family RNA polymerase sigma factor [Terracidiphilus sp.]|jgi:RNA polymerase sigma-70 factor, ECF subfamily
MFRRTKSTRTAGSIASRVEAALRRALGLSGLEGGLDFAGFALAAGGVERPAPAMRLSTPGAGGAGGPKSVPETDYKAQPSSPDGVPEDMATMVLDNPAMGAGSALPSGSMREAGLRAEVDPASDAAVMLRVAAGDEAGFNYLVGKYHRPMIHFLYRMVRNQAVAEELAQEVFLRVYRARDSYRAEARFTTWLYRIATNLAVNHARDTRHERAAQTIYLDAPDAETGTTPDLADDEPSVEQRLLRNERMAAIRSHVMALPERQRMAVLMHKYQGMDYRQIGEVLKLSESATKSLLFRAYQTLRDKLKDFV